MGRNLLDAVRLTKVFSKGGALGKSRVIAVDDVTFSIPDGKPMVFTIAGESGSGKSTIAKLVLGFLRPTSGSVLYKGRDIWEMDKDEWRAYRREVQAVFQDPYGSFNPLRPVDHVLWTPLNKFGLADGEEEAYEMITRSLEDVGLRPDEVLGKYPHQLSGGQRQRVMLARALLLKPRLVVADEPVSMIDASLRASILNIMLDLVRKQGASIIYITHDLSTAHYVSDQIMVMYRGSVVELGGIDKVINNPVHPYVKLLVSSIPVPDPRSRWRDRITLPRIEMYSREVEGCKFYDRCPIRVEGRCEKERPVLEEVESNHWVACWKAE